MVKLSKRTLSVVLTLLMVISMISFSGLTVSAATTKTTVETSAGTATYIVRLGTMSNVSVVGGVMGTLTYPAAKLTLDSATVSADFATKSENTATTGTIKWNGIGDVSYASNKAVLTVNFKIKDGQTVTADDFVGSGWQVVTKASASAAPVIATDGTGLIEEIGLPKADTPGPGEKLALKDDIAGDYATAEDTLTIKGEKVTVKTLLGVMPATTIASFKALFKNEGVVVLQNSSDTAVTTGNIKAGYRVQTADGNDTWYISVRGDCTSAGNCNIMSKRDITSALKVGVGNYPNYSKTESTLKLCKFYSAASANNAKNTSVNVMDKRSISSYIKSKKF